MPKYKYKYKANNLINDLIANQRDRNLILNSFKTNHSRAMELLADHSIICMQYCLEMDLLCSDKAVQEMSIILNLTADQSNRKFLLTERVKVIKKIENILNVLDKMSNRNLPNSFKRIKKELREISKSC